MAVALEEARLAASENEVPVGAAVFRNDVKLAADHNRTVSKNDMTAHAELLCLQKAAKENGGRLDDCTLYVTLEPCAMCFGAAMNLRIGRIVFGAYDPAYGACASACDLSKTGLAETEVVGGILHEECEKLLSDFFYGKRCIKSKPSV